MQIDPIRDGENWYAYVGNNPINWIDPLGLAYYAVIRNTSGTIITGGALGDTTFASSGYFHTREVAAILNNAGQITASANYNEKTHDVTMTIMDFSKLKNYQDRSLHINMAELVGKTAVGLTSKGQPTSVYFRSYKCLFTGTKSYVNLRSLTSYLGYTIDIYNQDIGKITNAVEFLDSTKKYFSQSMNQVILGNYAEDITWLGTGGQVLTGLAGVDLPGDIRDIAYDLQNWEWAWANAGQLGIDSIGLLPLVGALKYGDETIVLLKNGDKVATIFSKSEVSHILKRHHLQTFLKQVPRLSEAELAAKLKKKSFFNPAWSTEKILDAAAEAYAKAINAGVKNDVISYIIDGETITVVITNGKLETAYGAYKYTAEEVRALAGL